MLVNLYRACTNISTFSNDFNGFILYTLLTNILTTSLLPNITFVICVCYATKLLKLKPFYVFFLRLQALLCSLMSAVVSPFDYNLAWWVRVCDCCPRATCNMRAQSILYNRCVWFVCCIQPKQPYRYTLCYYTNVICSQRVNRLIVVDIVTNIPLITY